MARSGAYSQQIELLEQIHQALGSASKLDDFYVIAAALLVDPNVLGFSRAFLFRYDDVNRTFTGKLALGAQSLEEHDQFISGLMGEADRLRQQIIEIQRYSPEPIAVQPLYGLRYHSLWIQLLQGYTKGVGLHGSFQDLVVERDKLPAGHLLSLAAASPHAQIWSEGVSLQGVENHIQLPVVAGRLVTKRGLHGILLADTMYSSEPLDDHATFHFQGFLNHCCIWLDNLELLEELKTTTERIQEVDRLKSTFLSIVSHEFRTPLTAIIGFIHLIMEGKVGPVSSAQVDLLRRVNQQSLHLRDIVNDVLEIAEVEAGGMVTVAPTAVDPLSLIINVLPKVEARRGTKPITIDPLIRSKVPLIRTDPRALERIYFHLLDNAVKFTQEGRVTIEFQNAGAMLEITIADTGIGMSPDQIQRVFDNFYQVDSRLERVYSGLGLGLAVVKLLLKATNGQLRVESVPGTGSRFTISYPIASEGEMR